MSDPGAASDDDDMPLPALEFKRRGNAAKAAGKLDEAVQMYTKAIELDPSDAIFYSNRALVYNLLQKYREAIADGQKAIELKPAFYKGYSHKAYAHMQLGENAEAEAACAAGEHTHACLFRPLPICHQVRAWSPSWTGMFSFINVGRCHAFHTPQG